MHAEYIADLRLGLQAQEDVVAEEQEVAQTDDIARHAIVLGLDSLIPGDAAFLSTEDLPPLRVGLLEAFQKVSVPGLKALTQHFVSAALQGFFGGVLRFSARFCVFQVFVSHFALTSPTRGPSSRPDPGS